MSTERSSGPSIEQLQQHVAAILELLGYDLTDQHFLRSPERISKVWAAFTKNGSDSEAASLLDVVFDDEHDSLIQVGPISVISMCAHHGLPVRGEAWVGYIPDKRITGLSKLARLVHHYAHQLTVQERVTQQIANTLQGALEPLGTMVVIRAEHGCMTLRGVREPNALTTTSAVRGVFLTDSSAKEEFLRLIQIQGESR